MLEEESNRQLQRLRESNEHASEFSEQSIEKIIKKEVFDILGPIAWLAENQPSRVNSYADCWRSLSNVLDGRVDLLSAFMNDVRLALLVHDASSEAGSKPAYPFDLDFLSGDSHNGGKRPVLARTADGRQKVIKFSDPRAYRVLRLVTDSFSRDVGVDLVHPEMLSDLDNKWYIFDYLDEERLHASEIPAGMFKLGAITAIACALGFVDLHLENIVFRKNTPIIIDPECIFYNFSRDRSDLVRLLSTGLLSHNAHLSSLRGGVSKEVPLGQMKLHLFEDGCMRHFTLSQGLRNLLRNHEGSGFDPAAFKRDVLSGYEIAYRWLVTNRDYLCDLLGVMIPDDLRIRFLGRKTRHYSAVMHMLNMPVEDARKWREGVFDIFSASESFIPGGVSPKMLEFEIADMSARDVPFFWVYAGERGNLMHERGFVHFLEFSRAPKDNAINEIMELGTTRLERHLSIMKSFLEIDLSTDERVSLESFNS